MIAKADAAELARLTATFDEWTADLPFQWLDALRDKLILASEELAGQEAVREASREMDAGFSGAVAA